MQAGFTCGSVAAFLSTLATRQSAAAYALRRLADDVMPVDHSIPAAGFVDILKAEVCRRFSEEPVFEFMTIHGSKGLEWHDVRSWARRSLLRLTSVQRRWR